MKKLPPVRLGLSIFCMSILFAFAATGSAETFTTTTKAKKQTKTQQRPPLTKREPQGALQRGARGGNPLQMLNPKAPAQYGTAADSLAMDENGKWRGIKLFEIVF
jgi:hypothetical protein